MKEKILIMTYSAITVSILFVGGFFIYSLSATLAVPGGRFILMAPFLGFVLYFPLTKFRTYGLISKITGVFALILSYVNLFMGLAIFSSGLLTDITSFVMFRKLNKEYKIILTTSLYPLFATLTSFYVTTYITHTNFFKFNALSIYLFMLLVIFIVLLGLFGSYCGYKLKNRIFYNHK
ncbi:energy-coupling factor transport system substrate-specific component [Natranaerovirga hydrolytica]|uniref:Energy-coupling factor transport system substrate-specific component n=1 Tax=Natranaerovirga hydrolytica TaxID=680378 RepID=A0A4R1MZ18_9FIRM|nr:hypothetical protein [Natranaerovirga hydrolytica]TCK98568.1 energy-coupling factor transport system substrate-specific component [Natranaerovirga hydrolytica]